MTPRRAKHEPAGHSGPALAPFALGRVDIALGRVDIALGWVEAERAFRLVAPRATSVSLVMRRHPEDVAEIVRPMQPMHAGSLAYWETVEPSPLRYYRFRVTQPVAGAADETFDVADPRAKAVARQWTLGHPTWGVAAPAPFDWQGDVRPGIDVAHAIIAELHIRDYTVHRSARVDRPGTYVGLVDSSASAVGGLKALRDLGVNTVELLPVMAWPYFEPKRGPDAPHANPTGVNHWGYMPSFFFAPSERFSQRGSVAREGEWVGVDADGTFHDPGLELKQMVRSLHRAGIAVVLDVVFNHVSTEDANPILRLDPGTWLHRNPDGSLRSHSGCGNDLDTADPTMRALVVDAAVHWMREYHVDGFRLDLAAILDDTTLTALRLATTAEYPHAILISEPWSMAGYRLGGIADLGHTVWNDRYRNGIKGQHPLHGQGFIFGKDAGGAHRGEVAALIGGWQHAHGGAFDDPDLSLNYLESHDDLTLGDFVRLALGEVRFGQPVERPRLAAWTGHGLKLQKLAAAALLLSRGVVMLAQGQEWGRAKVQAGDRAGCLEGNSYNLDDATNHLDWRERARNAGLVDHYRRLIALRKEWLQPAFAAGAEMRLHTGNREWALGFSIQGPRGRVAVLLNGTPDQEAWFNLPGGAWWLLYGAEDGHIVPIQGGVSVRVEACAAVVLYGT